MIHKFKTLALAAAASSALALAAMAPAGAGPSGATATLNVNGTVTNACQVNTQPGNLNMSYDPLTNTPTAGTSSFTWTCSNGSSVSITPSSPNGVTGSAIWDANDFNGTMFYSLYNDLACTANQLTNGHTYSGFSGTGSALTYDICGIPNTSGNSQLVAANDYTDTVTFTFTFGP